MNTDELRDAIWEYLFRIKSAQSTAEIADHFNCHAADVLAAITHEWFNFTDGRVSIAYAASTTNNKRSQHMGFWD